MKVYKYFQHPSWFVLQLVKVYYNKRLAVVVFENTVVDIQQLSEDIEEVGFFLALGRVRAQ